jgi:hypothetical protein
VLPRLAYLVDLNWRVLPRRSWPSRRAPRDAICALRQIFPDKSEKLPPPSVGVWQPRRSDRRLSLAPEILPNPCQEVNSDVCRFDQASDSVCSQAPVPARLAAVCASHGGCAVGGAYT